MTDVTPAKKSGFLQSLGDFFTKDIPDGLNVIKTDIVHVMTLGAGIVAGPVAAFVATDVFPQVKAFILTCVTSGVTLTPAGIVTTVVAATLTGLWTIALHAPSNSVLAQVTRIIPNSVVQAEITKASTAAGNAVSGVKLP